MKIVALVPMKANSERVVGKNFKILGHKPLFKWIIDTLLEIKIIDQIVINTDAKTIIKDKGLKKNSKILIRDRKKEIQGDLVSMNRIIQDDLENIDSDIFIMTHTTNPFLKKLTIKKAIEQYKILLKKNKYDSMFSVEKMQDRFYDKDSKPINHNPNKLERTQDLEPLYKENSNFYLFSKDSFIKNNNRIGNNPFKFEMSRIESIDIDNQEDWDLAEKLASYNSSHD